MQKVEGEENRAEGRGWEDAGGWWRVENRRQTVGGCRMRKEESTRQETEGGINFLHWRLNFEGRLYFVSLNSTAHDPMRYILQR